MHLTELMAADEAIRAAAAAKAEQERVISLRNALLPELIQAENEVSRLIGLLGAEQRDVKRYEEGVWAFLYDLFADREARLSKEQQEVAAVELRHQEAVVLRDRLKEETAQLNLRIGEIGDTRGALDRARDLKESALRAEGDGPLSRQLAALRDEAVRLQAERRALEESIVAGDRARAALIALSDILRSARNWGAADLFGGGMFTSAVKHEKLADARVRAGDAQAELIVFQRELSDVGVVLDTQVAVASERGAFLDVWFDNIFSDAAVQSRIEAALDSTTSALELVELRLLQIRTRLATLAARLAELALQRERLLEP